MPATSPHQPIRVRPAELIDAPTLAAFIQAMARETEALALDPAVVQAGVRALLAEPRRGFYRVAERGDTVVGSLMVTFEWSDWRNADFWWVQSVYVTPEHRGQGVFRALYHGLREEAAQTGGVCGFRLYVEQDNHAAQRTYQALGMRPTHYLMYEQPL